MSLPEVKNSEAITPNFWNYIYQGLIIAVERGGELIDLSDYTQIVSAVGEYLRYTVSGLIKDTSKQLTDAEPNFPVVKLAEFRYITININIKDATIKPIIDLRGNIDKTDVSGTGEKRIDILPIYRRETNVIDTYSLFLDDEIYGNIESSDKSLNCFETVGSITYLKYNTENVISVYYDAIESKDFMTHNTVYRLKGGVIKIKGYRSDDFSVNPLFDEDVNIDYEVSSDGNAIIFTDGIHVFSNPLRMNNIFAVTIETGGVYFYDQCELVSISGKSVDSQNDEMPTVFAKSSYKDSNNRVTIGAFNLGDKQNELKEISFFLKGRVWN